MKNWKWNRGIFQNSENSNFFWQWCSNFSKKGGSILISIHHQSSLRFRPNLNHQNIVSTHWEYAHSSTIEYCWPKEHKVLLSESLVILHTVNLSSISIESYPWVQSSIYYQSWLLSNIIVVFSISFKASIYQCTITLRTSSYFSCLSTLRVKSDFPFIGTVGLSWNS